MKTVGSYEAKTHLAELLDEVVRGERIVITKRGRPVAMLVPIEGELPDCEQVIKDMLESRDQHGPRLGDDLTLRQLIDDGRRF